MSTFHESQGSAEQQPLDYIREFLSRNDVLVTVLTAAHDRPSEGAIESVFEQAFIAKAGISPLRQSDFFEGAETVDRRAAIHSVTLAKTELMMTGRMLNPRRRWGRPVDDISIDDAMDDLDDEESKPVVVSSICDSYDAAVDLVLSMGLARSEAVRRFMELETSRQQRAAGRNLGLIAAAGIIGYKLARKNRK